MGKQPPSCCRRRHANQSIVDVGGGLGGVLSAILRRNPSMRGILFERRAGWHDRGRGHARRCLQACRLGAREARLRS